MTDRSAAGCSLGGGSPYRWRLGTMMAAVAVVAACCRWPLVALGLAVIFGGPAVGGWLGRKRGDDGVIEGGVVGGVGSYVLIFMAVPLTLAAANARSLDLAHLPELVALVVLGVAFLAAVGTIAGMFVGAVLQVGVALVRERERRRQAAPDRERPSEFEGSQT